MDKNIRNIIVNALLFGALWGIIEVTLGHLLHYLPVLIAGSLMFPIAVYLMRQAKEATGNTIVIPLMALCAASLKLIDLLIPGLPPIKTLNPALAILFESLVVWIVFRTLESKRNILRVWGVLSVSFVWRILFVLSGLFIERFTSASVALVHSSASLFQFIVIRGAISTLWLFIVIFFDKQALGRQIARLKYRPALALSGVGAAAVIQFLF